MPFTYMGTKKQIVSDVAQVIEVAKRGPLLDLFSGIATVAASVSPARQVWCNDVEGFPYILASAKFTSQAGPELDAEVLSNILERVAINRSKLFKSVGECILEEDDVLHNGKIRRIKDFAQRQIASAESQGSARVRASHRAEPRREPYCLFSVTYAGGYIGSRQAFDIDCLRFSFDALLEAKKISADQHRWFVLALCKAMFAISNTTGHFAQYLDIKSSTLLRYLSRRRRDVFTQWASALRELKPFGSDEWRLKNKAFKGDAMDLLAALKRSKTYPAVIYADPPYSKDQYSRYYHLLETLIAYDYPDIEGKGQYRPDRFVSNFSLRSKVSSAFDLLVADAASLGSELIINYPEYGLLQDTEQSLLKILRAHFRRAELAKVIAHEHSTLGASKGIERSAVREMIFYARH
jgi:adenine-specific DNA-methyltransferase